MLRETAHAKFDLAIHIEPRKASDGFFPVHYIDCQLDLCDVLIFEQRKKDIEIICDHPKVPANEDNFIYKAAILVKKVSGSTGLGARIILKKNIPVKAGFGGGSSDAAAAVIGLCRLWKIRLNQKQTAGFGRELGKDFYYSLYGKLSEVVGKGKNYDIMPFRTSLPKFWLLVVVPQAEKPSTGWVYEHLKGKNIGRNFDKMVRLKKAIENGDRGEILRNLTNDFEDEICRKFPIVKETEKDLTRAGAEAVLMAGAGLSVVGFFSSKAKAEQGKVKLKGKYSQILITKPIN